MLGHSTAATNLALLGVLAGVIMSALYADGAFEYWDVLPGVFVFSMLLAYWRQVGEGFWVDLCMALMGGAGILMITGFFVEPLLIGKQPEMPARTVLELQTLSIETANWQTNRNNTLAAVWTGYAALVLGARLLFKVSK